MQLGISSYTYTWAIGVKGNLPDRPMTALDLLDRTHDLGVRVLQIADNLPLDMLSEGELSALQRRADELGIQIEVGTRGIDEEHLTRYLELASRFRSPILRVVVDTATHHPSEEEVVQRVRSFVPRLQRANIPLAIENHDRFRATVLGRMIRQIASHFVGICLDTVNSFGALEGPDIVLDALGPHVLNLHVKDFDIQRVFHMMGFVVEGKPAGQGRLDVPWLLQRLREFNRDGCNAILELWTPPEPQIADTVAKEDAWARQSVQYLRTLIPQ